METFAINLKKIIKERELKYTHLAKKVGYNNQTISHIANGLKEPRLITMQCISETIGCSLDGLSEHIGARYYSEEKTVGYRLKELRFKKRITSTELSKRTGVPASSIINFENGKNDIKFKSILLIAKELDFSLDWLCGR